MLVIPFYVFTAIGVFLVLSLLCRVLRLKLSAHSLAVTAVIAGIFVVLFPLFEHLIDLPDLTGRKMIILLVITFGLAALDAVLERFLPLPFDDELADV